MCHSYLVVTNWRRISQPSSVIIWYYPINIPLNIPFNHHFINIFLVLIITHLVVDMIPFNIPLNHHFSWWSPTISILFSMSRCRVTWRACWRILRSCHDPSWRSRSPGGRRPGFCGFYGFYMVSMVLKIWILDGSMAKVVIVRSLNGSIFFCWKSAVCLSFLRVLIGSTFICSNSTLQYPSSRLTVRPCQIGIGRLVSTKKCYFQGLC